MKNKSIKLMPSGEQSIRNHRMVFTETNGLLKKRKQVMLDIDEFGVTYKDKGRIIFSSMYESISKIYLSEITLNMSVEFNFGDTGEGYIIDLSRMDGNLWDNFTKIKDHLLAFAGDKVKIVR